MGRRSVAFLFASFRSYHHISSHLLSSAEWQALAALNAFWLFSLPFQIYPTNGHHAIICVVELDGLAIVEIKSMCLYSRKWMRRFFVFATMKWAFKLQTKWTSKFQLKRCALPWNEMLKLLHHEFCCTTWAFRKWAADEVLNFLPYFMRYHTNNTQKARHKFQKKRS